MITHDINQHCGCAIADDEAVGLGSRLPLAAAVALVVSVAGFGGPPPATAAAMEAAPLGSRDEKSLRFLVERDGLDQVIANLTRDISGKMLCDKTQSRHQQKRFAKEFGPRVELLLAHYHRSHPPKSAVLTSSCERLGARTLRAQEDAFTAKLSIFEHILK